MKRLGFPCQKLPGANCRLPNCRNATELSVTARCRDGPVMGIVFHARAPTYWSIQITSRKSSVRSWWSILLTSPNFLISLYDEFNLRPERYTAQHVVAAHE
jgi:hypothetical protein